MAGRKCVRQVQVGATAKLHQESRRTIAVWAGQGRADSKIINGYLTRRDEARRDRCKSKEQELQARRAVPNEGKKVTQAG